MSWGFVYLTFMFFYARLMLHTTSAYGCHIYFVLMQIFMLLYL